MHVCQKLVHHGSLLLQVKTLDGKTVWRRRHYRVRRAEEPGTFHFSVLDNGVISKEFWRIVHVQEDMSWGLFYYAGAASVVGQAYRGKHSTLLLMTIYIRLTLTQIRDCCTFWFVYWVQFIASNTRAVTCDTLVHILLPYFQKENMCSPDQTPLSGICITLTAMVMVDEKIGVCTGLIGPGDVITVAPDKRHLLFKTRNLCVYSEKIKIHAYRYLAHVACRCSVGDA